MIKSCYPTFQEKDRDHKLQRLALSDRWVRFVSQRAAERKVGHAAVCSIQQRQGWDCFV